MVLHSFTQLSLSLSLSLSRSLSLTMHLEIRFDLTCQFSVRRCQILDVQVAHSNNHISTFLSSPGATSAIFTLSVTIINPLSPPRNQCVGQINTIYLGPLQPTNRPQGLPAVFSGQDSTASTAIHEVCKRGEQKGFFCMSRLLFPPVPLPPPSPLS